MASLKTTAEILRIRAILNGKVYRKLPGGLEIWLTLEKKQFERWTLRKEGPDVNFAAEVQTFVMNVFGGSHQVEYVWHETPGLVTILYSQDVPFGTPAALTSDGSTFNVL